MNKRWYGNSAFRKIFMSYTAILIIPIIIFSALNVHRNIMEEQQQQYEKHASDAKRIADLADNKLNELRQFSKDMSSKTWVRKLMQTTNVYDKEFDLVKMIELRKDLENDINAMNILSFGMIVFPEKQWILSSVGTFPEDDFFASVAVFNPDLQLTIQNALSDPNDFTIMQPTTMNLWDSSKRVVPVLQSLETVNHPRAILVLFIDSAYFSDYIHRFAGTEYNDILISADQSSIFKQTRNTPDKQNANKKAHTIVLPSLASDWTYTISYTDNSGVWIHNLFSSMLAILISIAVGTCSALILARITYRPLYILLMKLSDKFRYEDVKNGAVSGSEYHFIEKSFDHLLHENQKLQQSMHEFESAARSNMLLRLLKGYFSDNEPMNGMKKFGISYTDNLHYCTMLVSFHAIHEISDFEHIRKLEMLTMLVVEQTIQRYQLDYELFEITNADKALILSSEHHFGDDGMIEQIASEIAAEMEQHCGFHPDVLCGSLEQGIVGISKSYYAAHERLQYLLFSRGHIRLMQEETILNEFDYYYPTDWEVQLINNLKIGNLDTSLHILQEISAENDKRQLSEGSIVKLVSLLMETMLRVLHEVNLDTGIYAKQFANLVNSSDTHAMWSYVFEVGTLICERNRYSNTSSVMEVGSELLLYVNMNYTSADVSLKKLADMFQMSTSNVSKMFKEVSGINFYDYLCRLRMEMAKELLREKKCKIDDIAHRVGYENVYSFKRAFTRYEGIKPDEYMQLAI
ncbi:helix-turn-helix transcriptional regulator [Paenibacillus marinisediminis]